MNIRVYYLLYEDSPKSPGLQISLVEKVSMNCNWKIEFWGLQS